MKTQSQKIKRNDDATEIKKKRRDEEKRMAHGYNLSAHEKA
jgi:hypothetical protein